MNKTWRETNKPSFTREYALIFFTTSDNLNVTVNYYNTDKNSHYREKASIGFAWKTNRALQRNVANM